MTAQVTDTIQIHGRLYEVCGIHGEAPFVPQSLGIVPVPPHTACWRGHINRYRIYRRRLVLEQLVVWLSTNSGEWGAGSESLRGPAINGVEPHVAPVTPDVAENSYSTVRLALPFTGGILAGRSFLRQLYVHVGFPPAWKFESVYEAIFDHGRLRALRDVSPQMDAIRRRMLERPVQPDLRKADQAELMSWITSTFELNYDWDSWL